MRHILKGLVIYLILGTPICKEAFAANPSIYSIYQGLNLGDPGSINVKDFYVNVGTNQGVGRGSKLEVYRHAPTFDLVSQQLYREVTFPIAIIKVIHVEENIAIARLESFLPTDQNASISPKAIMVGDLVKIPQTSEK